MKFQTNESQTNIKNSMEGNSCSEILYAIVEGCNIDQFRKEKGKIFDWIHRFVS